MKYTLKSEWFPLLIVAASWILSSYFYANFPETVITHWNFEGVPDGFSGKASGAFAIPGVITGMYLLFLALPFIDPKRERYASFDRVYHIFRYLLLFTMFLIYVVSGLINLGYDLKMHIVTPTIIGLLFIILGNYMGKIKQNWFMGFRLPWTLASENVWNKTNRLGGWSMALFGFIMIISPLFPRAIGMTLFIGGILFVILVPTIYSYLLYRKEQKSSEENTAV